MSTEDADRTISQAKKEMEMSDYDYSRFYMAVNPGPRLEKERRERIAIAVLAGLAAHGVYADGHTMAVQMADALIAELDRPKAEAK